jgi:hypothetical protein
LRGDQGQGLKECKRCQRNSVSGDHSHLQASKLTVIV